MKIRYRMGQRFAYRRQKYMRYSALAIALIIMGILGSLLIVHQVYNYGLRPVSDSIVKQYFTVEKGATVKQIATGLKDQGLVRSAGAFELYVRRVGSKRILLAGTYSFYPAMSTKEIADAMITGKVNKNLLTILPGKRLDQLKSAFKEAGYDQATIDAALNPANYKDKLVISTLPAGATLEGYLYPDSYEKLDQTSLNTIIAAALDEMSKKLTPDLIADFAKQGLTVHQAITLGSIVEQEVSNPADKPIVAQVFLSRLIQNIALGSDVTARYASILAGKESIDYSIDSAYNTRKFKGLPPGPISNVTRQSLEAVAKPSTTDYLFFVAGDDGITHFSRSQAEHEQLVKKFCSQLCSE